MSFGPFYPSLENPLDMTIATTEWHFYKFQYYLSIVPTIYTTNLKKIIGSLGPGHRTSTSDTVITNQYAVTEQSYPVGEASVPGIFFKYDIEPILLLVSEESSSLFALLVRLVNVVSGVLVALGWCSLLCDWVADVWGRKRKGHDLGVLHGRSKSLEEKFPVEKFSNETYSAGGFSPAPAQRFAPALAPTEFTPPPIERFPSASAEKFTPVGLRPEKLRSD